MNKKISLVIMIMLLTIMSLFAEKSFERLGNEAEFAGDELFNTKDYSGAVLKYQDAIANFNEAKTKDEIPVDDKLDRIDDKLFKCYYFGKEYDKAISVKKNLLAKKQKDDKTAKLIAQIYTKNLKQPNKAIEFLVDYDSKNPNSNTIVKKIASYYKKQNDLANALVWYKKSYVLKQDAKVINNIAVLHNNLGQTSDAIQAYQDFLKTNPKEEKVIKTYQNMGALYEEMKDATNSAASFEKANKMKYDKNITIKLISMYHEMGKTTKAKENIALLLSNVPGNDFGIYYRGLIAYENGDKVAAKLDFEKVVSSRDYGKSAKDYIASIDSE